jgi:hypothetical protein
MYKIEGLKENAKRHANDMVGRREHQTLSREDLLNFAKEDFVDGANWGYSQALKDLASRTKVIHRRFRFPKRVREQDIDYIKERVTNEVIACAQQYVDITEISVGENIELVGKLVIKV